MIVRSVVGGILRTTNEGDARPTAHEATNERAIGG